MPLVIIDVDVGAVSAVEVFRAGVFDDHSTSTVMGLVTLCQTHGLKLGVATATDTKDYSGATEGDSHSE